MGGLITTGFLRKLVEAIDTDKGFSPNTENLPKPSVAYMAFLLSSF